MNETHHPQGGHPHPAHHGPTHTGSTQAGSTQAAGPKIAAIPNIKPEEVDLEPLGLVDEIEEVDAASEKKIRAFGVNDGGHRRRDWKRTPHMPGHGAVRVRTFHGKLSDQGMEYLDNAINDWLDEHPDVEVKFVTSTVGTFEGKIREPALVLNPWY